MAPESALCRPVLTRVETIPHCRRARSPVQCLPVPSGTEAGCVPAAHTWRPFVVSAACFGLCSLLVAAGRCGEPCFECHTAPGLAERIGGGKRTTPAREELLYKGKAHTDLSCADCHPQATAYPHPQGMQPAACESCHEGVLPHAIDGARQDPDRDPSKLPTCVGCHGYHGVLALSDEGSRALLTAVPHLCIDCHRDVSGDPHPLDYLTGSVHARRQGEGQDGLAAVCTDCHRGHALREQGALLTGVTRLELAGTCGKCHEEALEQYRDSVHGQALARGDPDAPVCTSCHEEHRILPAADPASSVNPLRIPETCGSCHGAVPLATKHDLDPDVYETYRDSYHGTANRYGSLTVADCASCHGTHNILPSSDPRSTVYPANLVHTCGECHEGISEKVARGEIHVRISRSRSPALFWVAFGFKWLTIGTMAALIGHMILDLFKKLRLRWAARREARASGEQAE
jgi:hypothetical protein